MRHIQWIAISLSLSVASQLAGCSSDEGDRPSESDGAADGSHADARAGAGGSRTDAGSGGHAGSSSGGAGGAGGAGGTGGTGGTAGAGGSGGAGGEQDAEVEAATDAGEPEDVAQPEACAPEPDGDFCARLRKNCGSFNALNTCGVPQTAACGSCDESTCGGDGTLNVCSGSGPINRAQGGVVTASRPSDKAVEAFTMVFDNDIKTKWFARATTVWVAYQFPAGATYAINSYTVTSANDVPERDPVNWELQGTNDPIDVEGGTVNWVTVDTRSDQAFASRFQTNTYSFTNTTAYSAYRFLVTLNAGGTQTQFSELQLFDIPAPVLDGGVTDAAEGGSSDDAPDGGSTPDASEDGGSSDDAASDGGGGGGATGDGGSPEAAADAASE